MRRLFLALLTILSIEASAQDFSNRGKDFWLGYGNHVQMMKGPNDQEMSLYITSAENTSGKVEIPGIGFSQSFTVTANTVQEVQIPVTAALRDEGLSRMGIHVTALKDVVVYGHIYFRSVSGATVCLPTPTLGREYISVNYTQISNDADYAYSYFFVVATEDNTTVEIIPAAETASSNPAFTPIMQVLNKGEIYQVLSKSDLTGSTIRSINTGDGCKKIAVFCGSGKVAIGCGGGAGSSDNLFQQMYPTQTWGKKYITVSSETRSLNYFRVIKKDPGSVVTINGSVIDPAEFVNGLFYEFNSRTTAVIESDKPILVAQYFTTQQSCNIEPGVPGDPEMIFLNPVEQTLKAATVYSSDKFNIQRHYINIVVRNGGTALSSFRLDGVSVEHHFQPLPQDPGYAYAKIQVSSGTHNLRSDSGFNALAYGFGSAESYGYSAGTNLIDLYQYISIKNPYATVNIPSGCKNTPFYCAITLPYKPNSIRWAFNGLFPDVNIPAPVEDFSFVKDGRTLYEYRLPDEYKLDRSGVFLIKVIANNPTPDGCSGQQEIEFDLTIYDPPVINFEIDVKEACVSGAIALKDLTDGKGRTMKEWHWDMGDGSKKADKEFSYKYATPGVRTIKLYAISDVGCITEELEKKITINPLPVAAFEGDGPACIDKPVLVKNNSAISSGTVKNYSWNWGDGGTDLITTKLNTSHRYAEIKTYTVELIATSDKDCKSLPFSKDLVVYPAPVVEFDMPEICMDDPGAAFISKASLTGVANPVLAHSWDFGAGPGSTSLVVNPTYKYTVAGDYNVKLVVETTNGCKNEISKVFVVNSNSPKASATFTNSLFCDNLPVTVKDASTLDYGKIIRTEIYWDYDNDPLIKTVEKNPVPGDTYSHTYPQLSGVVSRPVHVKYVVYSGDQCVNEISLQRFELKAGPVLTGKSMIDVCQEVQPFAVTDWSETTGAGGSWRYTGPGISAPDMFFPDRAGAGDHRIEFRYQTRNGCIADSAYTIRVYPTPLIDAGKDLFLLEGGSGQLVASGQGRGLSYTWQSLTGLLLTTTSGIIKVNGITDMEYTLKAVSTDGCIAEDKTWVRVLKKPDIPNIFSPNGDGINDNWQINYLNSYPTGKVEVYNRYGQIVFRSIGYNKPWDGTVNGKFLPAGTYYYLIEPGNGRSPYKGSVTIIY